MSTSRAEARVVELESAVASLGEALDVPETAPSALDGTIQRFEFVFELSWKALKALLAIHHSAVSEGPPRSLIKEAFSVGWIADERAWLQMLDARNETSHTYKQEKAKEVYRLVKDRRAMFPMLAAKLRSLLPNDREN